MQAMWLGAVTPLLLALPSQVSAHSGRTDSSGGHHCNVGACAGTYHYHNGGSSYTPPPRQPVVTTKDTTETEVIEFETVEQDDEELEVGKTKTTREGSNGVQSYTYRITYTDGAQTSKELISSAVTESPVSRIIAVGTKPIEVVSASTIGTVDDEETASAGETVGILAVMSLIGYGLYMLGKFGLRKVRGD